MKLKQYLCFIKFAVIYGSNYIKNRSYLSEWLYKRFFYTKQNGLVQSKTLEQKTVIINIQAKTCTNGPQLNQKPLKAGIKRNLIMAAINSRNERKAVKKDF